MGVVRKPNVAPTINLGWGSTWQNAGEVEIRSVANATF